MSNILNELRIGNWFIDDDGDMVAISSWNDHSNQDINWDKCEGAPLIVKHLEQMGFESINNVSWKKKDLIIEDTDGDWDVSWMPEHCLYLCSIAYMHELQNLYFSLCREELRLINNDLDQLL